MFFWRRRISSPGLRLFARSQRSLRATCICELLRPDHSRGHNIAGIHPANKFDVGNRLALWALAKEYGKKDLVYSGPLYRQMTREANRIRLWFDHTGGGLVAKGGELRGFTIAGADRKFVPAEARIEDNTIVVSGPATLRQPNAKFSTAPEGRRPPTRRTGSAPARPTSFPGKPCCRPNSCAR